jgi:hypothetical protein
MSVLIATWRRESRDNQGLYASHSLPDNELCHGRYLSHHLHALGGARAGAKLARAAGADELADDYQAFHDELHAYVLRALEDLAKRTGGVITPSFEGYDAAHVMIDMTWETPPRKWTSKAGSYGPTGGLDWQNLALAWPFAVLPPQHPIVTSSMARWRHHYVEGIIPYPKDGNFGCLHNYNGIPLSGTWLRRGDWAEAVRDLYGLLLHTSASHASAEVLDSGCRWDYGCTPHNWFSGRFLRFARDCLVYEEGGDLHLLAGLSPAWMHPGMTVGVENLPTSLGTISMQARMHSDGLDLTVDWSRRPGATAAILHLPPFLSGVRVAHAKRRADGSWMLAADRTSFAVQWDATTLPDLSFERVAAAWLADYRQRASAS